ncbi:hypothetical protein HY990_06845 [Candidatus Micrarchaeota archaeon]|nr:hypothetical protein [Candidatus Micrarchaeota archaeon]
MQRVLVKRTRELLPFTTLFGAMLETQPDIKIQGTITNGNTREVLLTTNGRVFPFLTETEKGQIRIDNPELRNRIADMKEIESYGHITIVDADSMEMKNLKIKEGPKIVQHWSNEEEGDIIKIPKNAVLAAYRVLDGLSGKFNRAVINIAKLGERPKPGSREQIEAQIREKLKTGNIVVSAYEAGVRYYDMIITLDLQKPATQEELSEILKGKPRIYVDVDDIAQHDLSRIYIDAAKRGMPRPPIIACMTRERDRSTRQTIRLVTDPIVNIAAANLDEVRGIFGISPEERASITDLGIGIRTEREVPRAAEYFESAR